MSDQGDAGQWRPATSQSDQYSTPEETTGPLPAVSADEADAPGFPSVSEPRSSWSAGDDDDAPTGGFPAVSSSPGADTDTDSDWGSNWDSGPGSDGPADPPERSVFDPVERTSPSFGSPDAEDPGSNGTTPRFGTDVPDPEPDEPSSGPGSLGSSPSSFGSSFGSGSFGESSYESGESSFGFFRDSSFASGGFEDKPYDPPEYGSGSFSSGSSGKESGSSSTGGFSSPPPPAPERGATPEAQAEKNEFFTPDAPPPMWDKVVAPAGPPPKPGKPSSGNLRLPEWMRDENNTTPGGPPSGPSRDPYEEEGRSRRPLYVGVGILLAGLVAVAGVYLLKGNGDSQASKAAAPTQPTRTPSSSSTEPAKAPQAPVKTLPKFKGVHTKAAGRVADARSGLSYVRLNRPWALPPKKSPMTELGFSTSQFVVTEKTGSQPKHWGRLMSAQLAGAAKSAYDGPGTERAAAGEIAKMYEERMFNFRTKKRALASQPLTIEGHKGWLVSDYLTYRRPGLKATGDVVAVALVDTGKEVPGVLFM